MIDPDPPGGWSRSCLFLIVMLLLLMLAITAAVVSSR